MLYSGLTPWFLKALISVSFLHSCDRHKQFREVTESQSIIAGKVWQNPAVHVLVVRKQRDGNRVRDQARTAPGGLPPLTRSQFLKIVAPFKTVPPLSFNPWAYWGVNSCSNIIESKTWKQRDWGAELQTDRMLCPIGAISILLPAISLSLGPPCWGGPKASFHTENIKEQCHFPRIWSTKGRKCRCSSCHPASKE